jgi:hypothetical protein
MPGPAPAFKLLVSINAPVALLRAFLYRHLPGYWDDVTFILGIGLFWYWIALNILRFREGGRLSCLRGRPSDCLQTS